MKLSQNNLFRIIALAAFTVLIALTWAGEMEVWRKVTFSALFLLMISDKVTIQK